jgi:hypothetical protein
MKKILILIIPVVLLATGVALALMGIIKIPGLTPKGKDKAASLYAESKDPKVADLKAPAGSTQTPPTKTNPPKKPPAQKPPVVSATTQPEAGQKKLAKLWNELEAKSLREVTKDWKDQDLAPVLLKMDSGKVAEYLALIDPKKASSLSKELQKQASLIPAQTGT